MQVGRSAERNTTGNVVLKNLTRVNGSMKRLECLDGLRGVLALYVAVGHMASFAQLPGWLVRALSHGEAAVDVFFILSGMVILRSLDGFGYRATPFLAARVFRIFPVFLAVFALAVL